MNQGPTSVKRATGSSRRGASRISTPARPTTSPSHPLAVSLSPHGHIHSNNAIQNGVVAPRIDATPDATETFSPNVKSPLPPTNINTPTNAFHQKSRVANLKDPPR